MAPALISRRKATMLCACSSLPCQATFLFSGGSAPPPIQVAAVQMTAELGNVESNLARAERLVREALRRGARWVILPEFFTSGIAFHPQMTQAVRAVDGEPAQLLRSLAREGKATVGGSFLAWRDGNVYNTFVLALPDGSTLRHDKDHPTFWENCYYVGGHDDGVLPTPAGNVGAALCWELIRTKIARRLLGKVEMVVGGSCWWTAKDSDPADHPYRTRGLEMLRAAPGMFARILGVPVVHASHAGGFVGESWPGEALPYRSHYLGETQIVDARGELLARRSREEGEGVITASVTLGLRRSELEPIPDRFWIPEVSDRFHGQWESALKNGHEYYLSTILPSIESRLGRSAAARPR